LSETLRKVASRLLDGSMEALDFAFGTGSSYGIIGAAILVAALSYLVAGLR